MSEADQNGSAASNGDVKTCHICDEEIVKYKGLHYGAMTCYSCRAFFRRCHSADRKEPFRASCKNQVWSRLIEIKQFVLQSGVRFLLVLRNAFLI